MRCLEEEADEEMIAPRSYEEAKTICSFFVFGGAEFIYRAALHPRISTEQKCIGNYRTTPADVIEK